MREEDPSHQLRPPAAAGAGAGGGVGAATAAGGRAAAAGASGTARNPPPSPKRMRVLLEPQGSSLLLPASASSLPHFSSSRSTPATALADPFLSTSCPPSALPTRLTTPSPASAAALPAASAALPAASAALPAASAAAASGAPAAASAVSALPVAVAAAGGAAGRATVASLVSSALRPTKADVSSASGGPSSCPSSCPSAPAQPVLSSASAPPPPSARPPSSPLPPASTRPSSSASPPAAPCSSPSPRALASPPFSSSSSSAAAPFSPVSSSSSSCASFSSTSSSSSLPPGHPPSAAPASAAVGNDRVEAQRAALTERYLSYLRSIKDNWSSCHAARLVTPALLTHIRARFIGLSTPLKVRVLTSFLYIPSALRESSKAVLSDILHDGETDPNEWVKKLSRILLPFVATGRVDLRETDTETAFRIIHFLDEQRAQHPEEGQYRRKAGLEQQHVCDPAVELAAAEAAAAAAATAKQTLSPPEQQLMQQLDVLQPGPLEMTLFSARLNFDDLVKGIVRRGTQQLQQAMVSQQHREAAAAAAQQQQQQHSSPHLPLRKSSLVSGLR